MLILYEVFRFYDIYTCQITHFGLLVFHVRKLRFSVLHVLVFILCTLLFKNLALAVPESACFLNLGFMGCDN